MPSPDIPSAGAPNFTGGMEVPAHLIGLGHRRIGLVEGPPEATVSIARLHGYQAALPQAGLTSDPDLTYPAAFTVDAGFVAATHPLVRAEPRIVLVAAHDLQALGAAGTRPDAAPGPPDRR